MNILIICKDNNEYCSIAKGWLNNLNPSWNIFFLDTLEKDTEIDYLVDLSLEAQKTKVEAKSTILYPINRNILPYNISSLTDTEREKANLEINHFCFFLSEKIFGKSEIICNNTLCRNFEMDVNNSCKGCKIKNTTI
ncbi:MAG: hypothetical protein LBM25_04910 [Bacteroidales bacterium]|jgi:hypothetical protein|nr:hypothetical protein [Bacteroidales bacterium]